MAATKININVVSSKCVMSFETQLGKYFIYQFNDNNENVFIWNTTNNININKITKIKANIKNIKNVKCIRQIEINSCEVIESKWKEIKNGYNTVEEALSKCEIPELIINMALIHKIDSYIIISTISECLFYVSELFTQERKDTNQRT